MALLRDFTALAIGHAVDAGALLGRHDAVGPGVGLGPIDRSLPLLQAIGLAPREVSVANAALDVVLLVILAQSMVPIDCAYVSSPTSKSPESTCVRDRAELWTSFPLIMLRLQMYRLRVCYAVSSHASLELILNTRLKPHVW